MVYVLDISGNPLTPTKRHGKVRHLLETGKAVCVKRCPFTIRLTYQNAGPEPEGLSLGVDCGSKHIGLSVSSEEQEFFRSRTTAGYSCKPFYQKGIPKGQTAQEDALPEAQVFKPDRFQKERLAGTVRQAESRIPFESD